MKLKNKLPDLQNAFGAMELYATEWFIKDVEERVYE